VSSTSPIPLAPAHGSVAQPVVARALGVLFGVGSLSCLTWLALPHADRPYWWVVALVAVAALANALVLVNVSATIPMSWLGPILLAGTVLGSGAIAAAGVDNSALIPLYVGGGPFVFAFFSLRHALFQVAFAACCYAALLTASALHDGRPALLYGDDLAHVIVLVIAMLTVGGLSRMVEIGRASCRERV